MLKSAVILRNSNTRYRKKL